jgi:hypothetical protein
MMIAASRISRLAAFAIFATFATFAAPAAHAGDSRDPRAFLIEPASAIAPAVPAVPRESDGDVKPNPEAPRLVPGGTVPPGVAVPATQVLLSEGFEGAFPGSWTVFDNNGTTGGDVYWDDTNFRAYAGSWSGGCADGGANAPSPGGSYPANMDSWMMRGPFNLSDANAAALTFRYWNRSESGFDYFKFLVSTNGVNFYGYQTSGDSGGWQSGSLDLANVPALGSVIGQPQVWIAFVFSSDSTISNEGAYVDEVLLQKTTGAGADIRIDPLALSFNQSATTPIYVEIDWMEDGTHSHKPSQAVIDRIVQTYAAAGFTIHIDLSEAIPHQSTLAVSNSPSSSPAIQTLMSQYFDHAADSRYYYSIWGHNYSYNGSFTTSSGIADLPGRVHLVTLGSFSGQTGTFSNQAGTFIHEFGHNLGQRHGGGDNDNYEPNYLSVMNYFYQLDGIGPTLVALGFANTVSGFDDFSYSHGLMPSLNEASLNEAFGIGLGRPVDWNCSGTITSNLAKDIQDSNYCGASGSLSTLTDFDNWTSLASQIQTLDAGTEESSAESCMTWEEYLPIHTAVDRLRRLGLLPPDAPASPPPADAGLNARSFVIYNDGGQPLSVTSMALDIATSWIEWEPQAPFTVPAGGSQIVHVYVDFPQAPAGTTSRRILVQSNDPDESPYPGGVNLSITRPSAPACYTLTLSHSGTGGNPAASPTSSAGCPTGNYLAGAAVSLTASPSPGWTVSGWTGTSNNASTATTNTLTMPAAPHAASVQYILRAPLDFYTVAPCRAVDTRTGSPLASGVTRTFTLAGTCGVPASAKAAALNVTVLSSTARGNVTLWPADLTKPVTSVVNFGQAETRANNAILMLATNGAGTLSAQSFLVDGGSTHLIVDVAGYFQ